MKLLLPKQHGAWAMLIIPYWLGAAVFGFLWQHIPFFIGWTLMYLGTYPFLLIFKGKKISFYRKWTFIYMIPGLIVTIDSSHYKAKYHLVRIVGVAAIFIKYLLFLYK